MKRLWILGAADPEMAAIESLLDSAGESYVYATVAGKRCHPGNAYKHETVDSHGFDTIIAVECAGRYADRMDYLDWRYEPHVRIDHHREGDPGFGLPPDQYWEGSSLGQVMRYLGSLEGWSLGLDPNDEYYDGIARVVDGDPAPPEGFSPGYVYEVENAHLIAAADHCLAAAYRGDCPGVDPDDLLRWRVASRAAFQGRTFEEVTADVELAKIRLKHPPAAWEVGAYLKQCPNCGHCYNDVGHCVGAFGLRSPYIADLRGTDIPELPEAACRLGVAYVSSVTDRDGREKIVLGAASPEQVQSFLDGEIVSGLVDTYGDPARGYAGGYVQ